MAFEHLGGAKENPIMTMANVIQPSPCRSSCVVMVLLR